MPVEPEEGEAWRHVGRVGPIRATLDSSRNAPPTIGAPGTPAHPGPTRLLDRVRHAIRLRQFSSRTEDAYVFWIRRFIVFHGKRHPSELGSPAVTTFLSDLAVRRQVSASTQNQAFSALLFLYREVLLFDHLARRGLERIAQPLSRVASRQRGGSARPQTQAFETSDRLEVEP